MANILPFIDRPFISSDPLGGFQRSPFCAPALSRNLNGHLRFAGWEIHCLSASLFWLRGAFAERRGVLYLFHWSLNQNGIVR